jgi:phosphoglycolate phosphatase
MKYKSIIFDLDGTLIDSAVLTGQIIDDMLAARGIDAVADRELVRTMDAVGGEAMISAVMGSHSRNPQADLEEFRGRFRMLPIPPTLPFPLVPETLDQLASRGVSLAICSNKPQELCEKILSELGIANLFAAIIGSAPGRPRKPDPASALSALTILGSEPERAIFCGDSHIDLATAQASGLDACLVSWGYGTTEARKLAPTIPVIDTMTDMLSLVHGEEHLGSFSGG